MTNGLTFVRVLVIAAAASLLLAGVVSAGPAQIVIVNINAPGVGFNDPTPRPPVGGNAGTTLGQQRLIAALRAPASNQGAFVSGVAHLTNDWVAAGLITGEEKGKVQSAAARSK